MASSNGARPEPRRSAGRRRTAGGPRSHAATRPAAESKAARPAPPASARPQGPSPTHSVAADEAAARAELDAAVEARETVGADVTHSAADEMTAATPVGLPLRDVRTASPRPSVCPFLRSDVDGTLTFPVEVADPSNVCAALDEPLPQSMRQQELVCLVAAHADCPRYLRGVLVAPTPERRPAARSPLSPAVAASLAVLLVSAIVSVGYVAAAGGLSVPLAAAAPTATPTVVPTAVAVASLPLATVAPTPAETPEPTPAPTATAEATPAPTATPEPSSAPTPTPAPTRAPTPAPTSDRFSLLTACPNQSNCWIYVVRSGDNLYSIAHYFGVSQAAIDAMNPWVRTTSLRAGQQLRIPTPTR